MSRRLRNDSLIKKGLPPGGRHTLADEGSHLRNDSLIKKGLPPPSPPGFRPSVLFPLRNDSLIKKGLPPQIKRKAMRRSTLLETTPLLRRDCHLLSEQDNRETCLLETTPLLRRDCHSSASWFIQLTMSYS